MRETGRSVPFRITPARQALADGLFLLLLDPGDTLYTLETSRRPAPHPRAPGLLFAGHGRMPAGSGDMSDPIPLLDDSDPPPFRVADGSPSSPYVIAADHAGRVLPRGLGTLGLSAAELDTHIAWDIGIGGVAQHLAAHLEAFYIAQVYSRLVIDCNRPLIASSSIVQQSEYTLVPGNAQLTAAEAEARAQAIFHPYHERIEAELTRRERAGQRTIFVAMHSFTPRFKGFDRPWHCGVLYNRDSRLALPLLDLLRREGLEVGDNQPYSVSDDSDYAIPRYGEGRGNLCIELELRQDLITTDAQQARWGELVSRVLREAVASCDGQ